MFFFIFINPYRMENIVGYLAGFCTTIAFVPQVLMVIKTKDTRSISLGMYCLFSLGVTLWLIYGLQKNDAAMIVSNIVTISLASVVLFNKIRNFKSDLEQLKKRNARMNSADL